MADDNEAIAAPIEQEAPAIETAATTETAPADEPERILDPEEVAQQQEGELAAQEDDFEEFEWDGKQIKAPKGLKDGVLMHADYTKKTQAVSEKVKALESREAEITQKLAATEEELDARATVRAMDQRLAEYAKLTAQDWAFHRQTDPLGTENAWVEYQLLKEQRGEVAKNLETRQSERAQTAQQDLAKRVEETAAFAQKQIPGWKPEVTDQLVKFALERGIPEEAVKSNWSPTFYELLFDARIGKLARERQATAPKPTPIPVQPLATVGGKTTPAARGDLSSASMEEYIALRNKGVGGKPIRATR